MKRPLTPWLLRCCPLLEDRQCSVCCPTWGPPVQCCRWRLYLLLDRALRCPISRPAPPPQEIWKHDLQQRTRTKLGPSWDWQHKCEPGAGYFYSYSRTTGDSTIHLPLFRHLFELPLVVQCCNVICEWPLYFFGCRILLTWNWGKLVNYQFLLHFVIRQTNIAAKNINAPGCNTPQQHLDRQNICRFIKVCQI